MKRMSIVAALFLVVAQLSAFQQLERETGFLVLAPDRGFLGNEEVREAFEAYCTGFNAALVVITREETVRFLNEGIGLLERQGAKKIVVLPMFLSERQSLYRYAMRFFQDAEKLTLTPLPVTVAETASKSYLMSEILADRIADLSKMSSTEMLITVAQGAGNPDDATAIEQDIQTVRARLAGRFTFGGYAENALVDGNRGLSSTERLEQTLSEARTKNLQPVVIPLDFAWKADGMMSLGYRLRLIAQKYNALYDGTDATPHPNIALWLQKQSNAHLPITAKNLGVIFMPHGSTYNWNRTMADAVEPLLSKYNIEHAFSMGDAAIIERAVRKLEQRGARAIAVIRVFSMETSFKDATEYALGLSDGKSHGSHGGAMKAQPIRSGCVFHTLGGVEASPLFAEALLDRAMEVSKDPKSETVIVLAHGSQSEEENRRWEDNLTALTAHMTNSARLKGKSFRAIRSATWREDWPELREKAIQHIRAIVQQASDDGGAAIIIPARTTRGGPEEEWLNGLSYVYNGNGFAPHPMFVRWVEEQILLSLAHFNKSEPPPGIISNSKQQQPHKH